MKIITNFDNNAYVNRYYSPKINSWTKEEMQLFKKIIEVYKEIVHNAPTDFDPNWATYIRKVGIIRDWCALYLKSPNKTKKK